MGTQKFRSLTVVGAIVLEPDNWKWSEFMFRLAGNEMALR
jgi:hypothetical protein